MASRLPANDKGMPIKLLLVFWGVSLFQKTNATPHNQFDIGIYSLRRTEVNHLQRHRTASGKVIYSHRPSVLFEVNQLTPNMNSSTPKATSSTTTTKVDPSRIFMGWTPTSRQTIVTVVPAHEGSLPLHQLRLMHFWNIRRQAKTGLPVLEWGVNAEHHSVVSPPQKIVFDPEIRGITFDDGIFYRRHRSANPLQTCYSVEASATVVDGEHAAHYSSSFPGVACVQRFRGKNVAAFWLNRPGKTRLGISLGASDRLYVTPGHHTTEIIYDTDLRQFLAGRDGGRSPTTDQ